mmetsp:Transcript_11110/g.24672  ORF Transcript_11110/g.24672 Transcript_11110/m.24672 type:complete len:203 (-) Transcript_11110:979-1587(-)
MVSSDHLHLDACIHEVLHGLRGVVARRVEHRQDAAVVPGPVVDLHNHAEGLVARLSEIVVHLGDGLLQLLAVLDLPLVSRVVLAPVLCVGHLVRKSLGDRDLAQLGVLVLIHYTLVDGIKAHRAGLLVLVQDGGTVSAEDSLEVLCDGAIDRVFLLVGVGGQHTVQGYILLSEAAAGPDGLGVDGDTRRGKGAGFIRAEDGH